MAERTKAELEREIADLRAQLAAGGEEGEKALAAAGQAGEAAGGEGAPFAAVTHVKKRALLEGYAEVGTVKGAAELAGVSRRAHYHWMKADPDYAAAFAEAQEQAADAIEAELVRRAVHGVEEPVHYRGQRVDMVRKYSDVLLIFLLKGLRPAKYRDNYNPAVFQAGGNISVHLNVPRPGQEPAAVGESGPKVQIDPPGQVVDAEARELPE